MHSQPVRYPRTLQSLEVCTHKLVHTLTAHQATTHNLSVSCTHKTHQGTRTHNLSRTQNRSQLLCRHERKHKLPAGQGHPAHSQPPAEMHTQPHTLSASTGTLSLSPPAHAHSQPPLRAHPTPPHPRGRAHPSPRLCQRRAANSGRAG